MRRGGATQVDGSSRAATPVAHRGKKYLENKRVSAEGNAEPLIPLRSETLNMEQVGGMVREGRVCLHNCVGSVERVLRRRTVVYGSFSWGEGLFSKSHRESHLLSITCRCTLSAKKRPGEDLGSLFILAVKKSVMLRSEKICFRSGHMKRLFFDIG